MHIDIDFTLGMAELIIAGRIVLAIIAFIIMMTVACFFVGTATDVANMRPHMRRSFPKKRDYAVDFALIGTGALFAVANVLTVPWILGLL